MDFPYYNIPYYDFFTVSGQVDSIRMQDYTGVYAKLARSGYGREVKFLQKLLSLAACTHTHKKRYEHEISPTKSEWFIAFSA